MCFKFVSFLFFSLYIYTLFFIDFFIIYFGVFLNIIYLFVNKELILGEKKLKVNINFKVIIFNGLL